MELGKVGNIVASVFSRQVKALERDLGHLFPYFEFTVTEAKKPGMPVWDLLSFPLIYSIADVKAYLDALASIKVAPTETIYVGT